MRGRGPRPRRREAGFVLVEALAALVLVTATLVVGAAAIDVLRRVEAGGRARAAAIADARGAEALAALLAAAHPSRAILPGGLGPAAFEGDATRLAFVAIGDGMRRPAGRFAVDVALVAGPRGGVLVRTAPIGPGLPAPASPPERLVPGFVAARFAYMGEDGAWRTEWRGQADPPRAVRLEAVTDRPPPSDRIVRLFPIEAE